MPMRLSPSRRSSPCADIGKWKCESKNWPGPSAFGLFMPKILIAVPKIAGLMDFGLFPVAH
jgi:hypothetical protein